MKHHTITTIMTMTMTVSEAFAGHKAAPAGPAVAICLEGRLDPHYLFSEATADKIFARIGVTLEWRYGRRCSADALHIRLSENTPTDFLPGSLAYALPYEGTHIVVMLDRVRAMEPSWRVPLLLGHVLAHEITHILQACSHHSESGLMKARWIPKDYSEMALHPLTFTEDDIELIRIGMAHRAAARNVPNDHSETEGPGNRQ